MNYSSKNTISQQKADGPSDFLGITQSSGLDQQVVELVKREHDKAVDILTANREKLDRLAAFLYEKETITGEEFMHILGE